MDQFDNKYISIVVLGSSEGEERQNLTSLRISVKLNTKN